MLQIEICRDVAVYLERIQVAPALRMELLPAAVRVDVNYIDKGGSKDD